MQENAGFQTIMATRQANDTEQGATRLLDSACNDPARQQSPRAQSKASHQDDVTSESMKDSLNNAPLIYSTREDNLVLVIDDNSFNVFAVQSLLKQYSLEADVAEDAQQAI